MSREEYTEATKLLKIASTIQYTVYGVPSVFYGDEAGLEGGRDPFCRRTYPWGRENKELYKHYKTLGKIRNVPVFKTGDFKIIEYGADYIIYQRSLADTKVLICANMGNEPVELNVKGRDLLTGKSFCGIVESKSAAICYIEK